MKCPECNSDCSYFYDELKIKRRVCKVCKSGYEFVKASQKELRDEFIKKLSEDYQNFSFDNSYPKGCYTEKKDTLRVVGVKIKDRAYGVFAILFSLACNFLLGYFLYSFVYSSDIVSMKVLIFSTLGMLLVVFPMLYLTILGAYNLIGKIECIANSQSLRLFKGIGRIGINKRIYFKNIKSIEIIDPKDLPYAKHRVTDDKWILISAKKGTVLRKGLTNEKLEFMYHSLQKLWEESKM